MKKHFLIAIDGPAGAGKSTIAKIIAKQQRFLYIDSGAMYRAVALYMLKNKLVNVTETKLKKHLSKIKISFLNKGDSQYILLNGKDVTREIRTSSVNRIVSEVSSKNCIRSEMVRQQRAFALMNSVVMDGRDIGTKVFPQADLKVYLTASVYVRAMRRRKDLMKLSERVTIKELVNEISKRDNHDSSRVISPLCKPHDAIVIDSTSLSIPEIIDRINILLPIT